VVSPPFPPLSLFVHYKGVSIKSEQGGKVNERLVIGFGTGRCGTKSLAAFLNQQHDITCTHEEVIVYDPQYCNYFAAIDMLMRGKDSPIMGDVSVGWLNYIDRIMIDFPRAKFICLDRGSVDEVVESFDSYLRKAAIVEVSHDLRAIYPIHERKYSKEAVRRSVDRYLWKQQVLLDMHPSILKVPTNLLSTKTAQMAILDHIGISRGAQERGMPWINKREDMGK